MATLGTEFFSFSIESNVDEFLNQRAKGLVEASRRAVRQRVGLVKRSIKATVRAGLGARVANAIGSYVKDIPEGIEGAVFSKAKVHHSYGHGNNREHVTFDLFILFQSSETVTARNAKLMAIPLPAAGTGPRGRAARPSDFPIGVLIAKIKDGKGILVSKFDPNTPLFILIPVSRRPTRLDFAKVRALAERDLTADILKEWAKTSVPVALKLVA